MDKVQQRRNASQGGGWCHVKLGWQLPGSTFETPKKHASCGQTRLLWLGGQVPYVILVELFLIRILRDLNVSWILHLRLHPGILVLWNCRSNFLASSSSRFRVLFPQFRPRHGTCYAVHRGCGLDPHGNLALPVTVFFMDGNAMVQSYTTVVHEFHISYSDWLVVSNMAFIFHFICGISSQPHWRTHIFQRGCGQMISRIQDDPRSFWSQIIDRPVMNLPSYHPTFPIVECITGTITGNRGCCLPILEVPWGSCMQNLLSI